MIWNTTSGESWTWCMHRCHVIQCPKYSKTKPLRHGFPVEAQRLRVHHQQYHQNSIINADIIATIAVAIGLVRRLLKLERSNWNLFPMRGYSRNMWTEAKRVDAVCSLYILLSIQSCKLACERIEIFLFIFAPLSCSYQCMYIKKYFLGNTVVRFYINSAKLPSFAQEGNHMKFCLRETNSLLELEDVGTYKARM